jgi:type IV pilus assembly protein PilW
MRARSLPSFQGGLSMVELMVAMVIALIGIIIMFQVFEVSEGIKRTTTTGGDAQQNGVIGLYVMESDLRQAGMGFNDTSYAGCTVRAYDTGRAGNNFSMTLVPVQIAAGANASTPDRLTVFYGSQQIVGSATTLATNMADTMADMRVINPFGFRVGDLVVLREPTVAPALPKDCAMVEITNVDIAGGTFQHKTGIYSLSWAAGTPAKAARANPPAGFAAFIAGGFRGGQTANATRVFNLGNLYDRTGTYAYNGNTMPVYNTYSISTTTLTVASAFNTSGPATPVAVADNIVHMRVLYGLDDGQGDATVPQQTAGWLAGDGLIDRFVDGPKFVNNLGSPYSSVIAVKLVLVARSAQPEVGSGGPGSACDTTTAPPTWSAQTWPAVTPPLTPANLSLDLSADGNWQCYRYKTFETIVPLRNWIWKAS